MYTQATCLLSLLALSVSQSRADIYIEIASAAGPDGATNGEAVMGAAESLGVWIWSDTPGISIMGITLGIDGRSMQGITGNGGDYQLSGLGTADPDGNFFGVGSNGTFVDQYTIADIEILGDPFAGGTQLPSSMNTAFLLYTDFSGTPWTARAGVMPTVEINWGTGAPQTVHTYGWYQTPTPGTLALFILAAATTKRRR